MGRQPGTSKTCHRTERVLRRISMLLRLHRIKARMATTSSSNTTSSSVQRQPQRLPQPHPQNLVPSLPAQSRQRMATSSSSSHHRLPEIPFSSLNAMLQRSGRASLVFPQLLRVESTSRDSKRSLRFSHRRRHSQQMQRQLERQASSEQPNRPPRVRVVAVVIVPHPHVSSSSGGSCRSNTSGHSSSSSSSRRRRTSSRSNRMALPGRPHVLNLVRRMLVPMVVDREARNRRNQDNVRRILVQEQQAPAERTPEKGNRNGGGDVDDKKMG